MNDGPSPGQTYNGYDDCVVVDQWQSFCGRSWVSWLDDAYAGRVTIFTGDGKWSCVPGQLCSIELGHHA